MTTTPPDEVDGLSPRPTFFVIGAPKAGTTAFCDRLGMFEGLMMSRPKEPNILITSRDDRTIDRRWTEVFAHADRPVRGEGSTNYSLTTLHREVPELIGRLCPNASIVYLVRDPFARLASHWVELRSQRRTDVPGDFATALRTVPDLLAASRYGSTVTAYQQHCGEDRLLVLFFEDYVADPNAVAQRAATFLGSSGAQDTSTVDLEQNATATKREDPQWLRSLRAGPGRRLISATRSIPGLAKPKTILRRAVGRSIEPPAWSPASVRFVLESIGDDLQEFVERYPRARELWSSDFESM